jgi:hypothetical protein
MNLHPTENRPLLDYEEIIESWPRSWPNSPILILTTREIRGIGIFGVFLSWGAQSLQIFWPGFFRLILHRGFFLVLYDDLFFRLSPDGFTSGSLKPKRTWRLIPPPIR